MPVALVVGLCAHGLAMTRCLASHGVQVYAFEQDPLLPGVHTNSAQIKMVPDINREGLIEALIEFRPNLGNVNTPVLLLTNDHMVRTVSENWRAIEGMYKLSWSRSKEMVSKLLQKSYLETHCEERGLAYPKSKTLRSLDELMALESELEFPIIVKPVRPLSSFKVRRLYLFSELVELVERYKEALPFLIQQWIPGNDEDILFSALYYKDGVELARFDGQKLLSLPRALGQTTAAKSAPNDEVYKVTQQFFAGTGISGPLSLELKKDCNNKLWVIEPTIGRTDYWVDCCIVNDVEFPLIEYCDQGGQVVPTIRQSSRKIWIDAERDPFAYITIISSACYWKLVMVFPRFTYLSIKDFNPFIWALKGLMARIMKAVLVRIKNVLNRLKFRGD